MWLKIKCLLLLTCKAQRLLGRPFVMKTFFLLVLLSQNGVGDINASFVNTETPAQCQQKRLMVQGVFSSAKIPILESRCIRSKLQFSEFGHTSSTHTARHFYLIHFDKEMVNIKKMPDWRSCMAGQREAEEQNKIYCSSSIQSLEE